MTRLRSRVGAEGYFFVVDIVAARDQEWTSICDGATGKILEEQRRIDIIR